MKRSHRTTWFAEWTCFAGLAISVSCLIAFEAAGAYAQALSLDSILTAHGVKSPPPQSVQMNGTVVRNGGKPEPFRILATADEQLRIDYGASGKDAIVFDKKLSFHDDGEKSSYGRVPPGFAQLDVTGLFFIEQLRNRPVQVYSTPDQALIPGTKSKLVRVESDRTEVHKGAMKGKRLRNAVLTDMATRE